MPDRLFVPAHEGSRVDHLGTYQRVLPVSLERMFENTIDWEHLPWLHRSSFSAIACEDAGPWGWRAWVKNSHGADSLLELRLDTRQRRWVTRTLEGAGAGAEIWTYVVERGPQSIEVVIDFFVPGIPEASRQKLGQTYARIYETLYDEDVMMMEGRHRVLNERIPPLEKDVRPRLLGAPETLRFPHRVGYAGRPLLIWKLKSGFHVTAARCPHQGAELAGADVEGHEATCPWHGYRFDLVSGECPGNSTLTVATAFSAWLESGNLWVGWHKDH